MKLITFLTVAGTKVKVLYISEPTDDFKMGLSFANWCFQKFHLMAVCGNNNTSTATMNMYLLFARGYAKYFLYTNMSLTFLTLCITELRMPECRVTIKS